MRYHDSFAYLPSSDAATLSQLVCAENVAVARLEPAHRQLRQTAMLDIVWASADRVAVVTGIVIDGAMISDRENTPLIWPRFAYESVDHEQLLNVQTEVEYWLFSHAVGKQLREPALWMRRPEFASAFEFARESGFAGAIPYAELLQELAPYVYAANLSRGKRVAVRDLRGANGATLLTRHAVSVCADLGSAGRNAAARRWFGRDIFGETTSDTEVAISADGSLRGKFATVDLCGNGSGRRIDIARPVPVEVMISFDPDDSESAAHFHVEAPSPALRSIAGHGRSAAIGGSSGVIALALRDDAARAGDADSDDALELARRLRGEGFDVRVGTPAQLAASITQADLVHISSLAYPHQMLPLLRAARDAGKPVVARTNLADVSAGPAWGMALAHITNRLAADEVGLRELLGLFAKRRLETDNANPKYQEPYDGYERDVRDALSLCDAVLVSGTEEEQFVRSRGYTRTTHVAGPIATDPVDPAAIEHIAATGEFVLAHAPIDARANPFFVMRAAREAGLPLVFAGPVIGPDVYMLLREFADETVTFALNASPAEIAALYRSARVFADVGWASMGGHRLAQAALSGASLVCSNTDYYARLWGPGIRTADPASIDSIARALRGAWDSAGRDPAAAGVVDRVAMASDPAGVLAATVTAYAAAAEAARLNYVQA